MSDKKTTGKTPSSSPKSGAISRHTNYKGSYQPKTTNVVPQGPKPAKK